AKKRREFGASRWEATLDACELRLRPIIMTSLAFILGVVPLVISTGAGSEMRQTLGVAVFSGMLGVTLFGIFLTPVFYYVIQWMSDRRAATGERFEQNLDTESKDDAHYRPSDNGHQRNGDTEEAFDSDEQGLVSGDSRPDADPEFQATEATGR